MTEEIAVVEKGGQLDIKEENKALADMYSTGTDDFNQEDLVISRLLLAQSQSKYVQSEKAKAGQIVGSLEHDLLAEKGDKLEIIPFHRYKSFRLFKPQPGGGTPKFIAETPYSAETITWEKKRLREVEWEYVNADKVKVKEMLSVFITWNYYCLIANQVELLPRVISFASTSYQAGKNLGTFALEADKQGYPLPFKTYKVGTELMTNDKGSFYRFMIEKGRDTTDEELSNVGYWAELAKKGEIVVDEGDEDVADAASTDAPDVDKGVVDKDAQY